jgi:hypothetical protein
VYPGQSITASPSGGGSPTPPAGDDTGDAYFVSTGSCGQPGQDPCSPPPDGGEYRYSFQYINQSHNDASDILGCTWDWGDGTVQSYGPGASECQFNNNSPVHTYPKADPELPYPQSCLFPHQKLYTVTLTMNVKDGSPPPYTKIAGAPYCKPKN